MSRSHGTPILTSRNNEAVGNIDDGIELGIILDIVADLATEVSPETVDPLGETAELFVVQLGDEFRLRRPIFRSPRDQFEALFVKVLIDELE